MNIVRKLNSHNMIRILKLKKFICNLEKYILVLDHMVNLYKIVWEIGWEGLGVWHYILKV